MVTILLLFSIDCMLGLEGSHLTEVEQRCLKGLRTHIFPLSSKFICHIPHMPHISYQRCTQIPQSDPLTFCGLLCPQPRLLCFLLEDEYLKLLKDPDLGTTRSCLPERRQCLGVDILSPSPQAIIGARKWDQLRHVISTFELAVKSSPSLGMISGAFLRLSLCSNLPSLVSGLLWYHSFIKDSYKCSPHSAQCLLWNFLLR